MEYLYALSLSLSLSLIHVNLDMCMPINQCYQTKFCRLSQVQSSEQIWFPGYIDGRLLRAPYKVPGIYNKSEEQNLSAYAIDF